MLLRAWHWGAVRCFRCTSGTFCSPRSAVRVQYPWPIYVDWSRSTRLTPHHCSLLVLLLQLSRASSCIVGSVSKFIIQQIIVLVVFLSNCRVSMAVSLLCEALCVRPGMSFK